jgi:hypothetical protein
MTETHRACTEYVAFHQNSRDCDDDDSTVRLLIAAVSKLEMADPVRDLKEIGRDLSAIPIARLPPSIEKAAFLTINTYTSYRLNLGTSPLNDALLFAKRMKKFGFALYFLHNPHARNFLRYLDVFFRNVTGQLVLYYVGQGNGALTDAEATDEAFVFDDGPIYEDDLITHLIDNKNPNSEVILVTDACNSGTIWDIQDGTVKGRQLPPGVLSISAANAGPNARQITNGRTEYGAFTASLVRALKEDPAISPTDLAERMRGVIRERGQNFTTGATVRSLLQKPTFSS